MPIENDFPFLTEKGHIVSLVGGGGKTTLMYAMAVHCVRKNWHVLVTTTTHIMRPAALSGRRRTRSFSVCGNTAAMPLPEQRLPAGK